MATDPQNGDSIRFSVEKRKTKRRVLPVVPLVMAPFLLLYACVALTRSYGNYGSLSDPKVMEYGPSFSFFQFTGVALYFYLAYVAFKKGFSGWGWIFGFLAVAFNPFPVFATGIMSDPVSCGAIMLVAIFVMVVALVDSPKEERDL